VGFCGFVFFSLACNHLQFPCNFFKFRYLLTDRLSKILSASNLHIIPPQAGTAGLNQDPREAELLSRVSRGEESAFRELFGLYQPGLLFLVHKITRNMSTAEEIVQDIFLKIWQTRESLSEIKRFKRYLFIISRNQALKLIDKEIRERNRHAQYEKESLNVGNDQAETERAFHLIDEAIDRLPKQQKTAWLLSRHEGLTYEQIANQMGLSKKTVQYYIAIATDSIKSHLSDMNLQLLFLLIATGYL